MLHELSESDGVLRAILTISESEAQQGMSHVLYLLDGRYINVVVPAGAYNGQVLHLKGPDTGSDAESSVKDVLLTIVIQQTESIVPPYTLADEPTPKRIPTRPLAELGEETLRGSASKEDETIIRPKGEIVILPDEETINMGIPPMSYPGDDEGTARPFEDEKTITPPVVSPTPPFVPHYEDREITLREGFPTPPPTFNTPPPPRSVSSWRAKLQPLSQGVFIAVRQLRVSSWWRTILLEILAFLIIVVSSSFLYIGRVNQLVASSVQTTATAQIKAVSTAYAATTTVQASATASTALDPYPSQNGTLVFYDPLSDNTQKHSWTETPGCTFTGGTYHVSSPQNSVNYCLAGSAFTFKNFTYEAQITILNGDTGGIIFRFDSTNNTYYNFNIDTKGGYTLSYVSSSFPITILNGTSKAIKTVTGSSNMLAVVARGRNLDLYVNNQHVAGVNDSLAKGGQIGVAAGSTGNTTEVACADAKVWNI
ncbi:MAG TPA: hypothetical protein VKR06_13085 [Ktedonosporobacter sp.]|nr:hypothetical protein [Ktedonosporobacter sp.]